MPRRKPSAAQPEARDQWTERVSPALDRYRRFLRQPGRWLYVPWPDCPCGDPVEARDELEAALRALPPRARADLRRVLAPLDAEFRRRTLPDPAASSLSRWHAEAWWRQRLHER
ncbi:MULTISPECIES: hypothetical protein [Actinomycetes]|uniref:hypothetical protein n=1 Tax=Actinomycetes TaxID=1760 RepID=UPI0001B5664B|nr:MULTISPECIES: hypothetical protein [Actinomycetes]EFL10221.1 predicted protein [Streptomyces sp. AA4]